MRYVSASLVVCSQLIAAPPMANDLTLGSLVQAASLFAKNTQNATDLRIKN